MYVWETSQGVRTLSAQQLHNQCVNYPAFDALKNVATAVATSICSGDAAGSGHRSIVSGATHGVKGNAISSQGRTRSGGPARTSVTTPNIEPGEGKTVAPKTGPASSCSREPGTDNPPSSCPLERTLDGNVTGSSNNNVGGASLLCTDNNLYHHHHHHRHPQEQQAFNLQQICANQYQVHPPVHVNQPQSHHPDRRKSDNKASTYGMNYSTLNCTNGNYASTCTPWKTREYSPGVLG